MTDFMVALTNLVKLHEGFRSEIYADTRGFKTIGYGHNLSFGGIPYRIPISLSDATLLLVSDLNTVIIWISKHIWWGNLTDNRKMCLIDLAFNVGETGFQDFKEMIIALTNKNYTEAAYQMKSSKWFTEVGHRGWQDYLLMAQG
jgi:lysozyme